MLSPTIAADNYKYLNTHWTLINKRMRVLHKSKNKNEHEIYIGLYIYIY